jgi:hypothetical protein
MHYCTAQIDCMRTRSGSHLVEHGSVPNRETYSRELAVNFFRGARRDSPFRGNGQSNRVWTENSVMVRVCFAHPFKTLAMAIVRCPYRSLLKEVALEPAPKPICESLFVFVDEGYVGTESPRLRWTSMIRSRPSHVRQFCTRYYSFSSDRSPHSCAELRCRVTIEFLSSDDRDHFYRSRRGKSEMTNAEFCRSQNWVSRISADLDAERLDRLQFLHDRVNYPELPTMQHVICRRQSFSYSATLVNHDRCFWWTGRGNIVLDRKSQWFHGMLEFCESYHSCHLFVDRLGMRRGLELGRNLWGGL